MLKGNPVKSLQEPSWALMIMLVRIFFHHREIHQSLTRKTDMVLEDVTELYVGHTGIRRCVKYHKLTLAAVTIAGLITSYRKSC